jgi:hypothetical protein
MIMLAAVFLLICFIGTKREDRDAARLRQRPFGRAVGLITALVLIAWILPEIL